MDSGLAGILREPQEPAPRNDSAYDSNFKNDELAPGIAADRFRESCDAGRSACNIGTDPIDTGNLVPGFHLALNAGRSVRKSLIWSFGIEDDILDSLSSSNREPIP